MESALRVLPTRYIQNLHCAFVVNAGWGHKLFLATRVFSGGAELLQKVVLTLAGSSVEYAVTFATAGDVCGKPPRALSIH